MKELCLKGGLEKNRIFKKNSILVPEGQDTHTRTNYFYRYRHTHIYFYVCIMCLGDKCEKLKFMKCWLF